MKCPRCQQENPSHANFCLACASPVDGLPLQRSYADLKDEIDRLQGEIEGLRRSLGEALEQQTATAEILRVISSSPTDVQPVFQAIADSAQRLFGAWSAGVFRYDGNVIQMVAGRQGTSRREDELPGAPRPLTGEWPADRAIRDRAVQHIVDVETEPSWGPQIQEWARVHGWRSLLQVPMMHTGDAIGVIAITRAQSGGFSPTEIALLQTFADQAVIAIENVRLFTELQGKNRALTQAHSQVTEALERQTATSEILRVIASSPTDVQPVLEAVVENASRLCGAGNVSLYRIEGGLMHKVAEHGPPITTLRVGETRPIARTSVPGRAIVDRATIHLPDHQSAEAAQEYPDARRDTGIRTTIGIPLLREGIAVGAFTAYRTESRPFTGAQIALLQTFADQAVIAIENVRLFKELEARNRELSETLARQTATAEVLRAISGAQTDARPVFDIIATSARRLCSADFGGVTLYDGELMHLAAVDNVNPEVAEVLGRVYPMRADEGSAPGRAIRARSIVQIADALEDPAFAFKKELRTLGFRSILAVPMLRDSEPIGTINVVRAGPGPFSVKQIELLKTFADQAVIAIENVRLFTELQARNRDLTEALDRQTATAEVLRVISQSQTEVQPVFDAIVDNAMQLFRAWSASAARSDGERVYLIATRGGLPGSEAYLQGLPGFYGPHRRCIATRAVVHISDVESDPTLEPTTRDVARARGWRSALGAPMLRDGQPIGSIVITRAEAGPFSPTEIALLQTFADQAVIAIENARLLGELRARTSELSRSVDELRALADVSRALSSTLELDAVLQTIVSRANQMAGTDACSVFEYDEATEAFHLRATNNLDDEVVALARQTPIRRGEGVQGRMAVTRQPVQVPDIAEEDAYHGPLRDILLRTGTRAVLAIPMLRENELIGGLTVNKKTPGAFSPEVIELLTTFATQSALAIQNARLFKEIEEKSRQLEVASQHKSEFLANMSHELRTPLNAVIGFSELLSERLYGELNEKQEEYLKDIHASGQHLLSLINDILDLSKIEAGRMELELTDFDLPTAINNALTLLRERAGRHAITLHMSVDERVEQVRADERKIRQVVLNLLSNAIKFTPDGGRINVRARAVDGSVEVSVTDTGVGIAPEDQEAIFEEFRQVGTAAKKVEGTGLGLALSRKFVELHGGRVGVQSELGVGSTFTFTIPTRQER